MSVELNLIWAHFVCVDFVCLQHFGYIIFGFINKSSVLVPIGTNHMISSSATISFGWCKTMIFGIFLPSHMECLTIKKDALNISHSHTLRRYKMLTNWMYESVSRHYECISTPNVSNLTYEPNTFFYAVRNSFVLIRRRNVSGF